MKTSTDLHNEGTLRKNNSQLNVFAPSHIFFLDRFNIGKKRRFTEKLTPKTCLSKKCRNNAIPTVFTTRSISHENVTKPVEPQEFRED